MVTIINGEWIADLGAMTCRSLLNNVVVRFEREGIVPHGKIEYMPMDLFAKFAAEPDGERKMAKLLTDAEEVFFRAYIESDFDRQDKIYRDLDNEKEGD